MNPMIEEFALRNGAEDVTDRVLATPGRLYLICVTRFDRIGRRCEDRLERLVERALQEGRMSSASRPNPCRETASIRSGKARRFLATTSMDRRSRPCCGLIRVLSCSTTG